MKLKHDIDIDALPCCMTLMSCHVINSSSGYTRLYHQFKKRFTNNLCQFAQKRCRENEKQEVDNDLSVSILNLQAVKRKSK